MKIALALLCLPFLASPCLAQKKANPLAPIQDEPEREAGRKAGDDLVYNLAALAVMKKHGVAIDDLHAVMAGKMDKNGTQPGNVHFTPEGSAVLAKQVAAAIKAALPEPR